MTLHSRLSLYFLKRVGFLFYCLVWHSYSLTCALILSYVQSLLTILGSSFYFCKLISMYWTYHTDTILDTSSLKCVCIYLNRFTFRTKNGYQITYNMIETFFLFFVNSFEKRRYFDLWITFYNLIILLVI